MPSLVALSVGPIQEFIAAARRTRDLFAGSKLLSELSKAAAKGLKEAGGITIFPAPACNLEFDSEDLIANIILAEVDGNPSEALEKAKKAVQECWINIANKVYANFANEDVLRKDVWDSQISDVLELYGAWESLEKDNPFQSARASLMRILAGRKSLRNFSSSAQFEGLPKSSLDGQRDTVLVEKPKWSKRSKRLLRVKKGEQLDCIGVIKRAWKEADQVFPSVSRIAADSWLRGIHTTEPKLLSSFKSDCEEMRRVNSIDLGRLKEGQFKRYEIFPLEGSALYPGRHKDLIDDADDKSLLEPLKKALGKLTKDFKEPDPYVAVLLADGDKMGEAISKIKSATDLRKFSKSLNDFAINTKTIVEEKQGTLVYSGGDDVLAILPVDQCIECAQALRDSFDTYLKDGLPNGDPVPTLSVGIAIGHSIEDLEDLLNYARDAEKNAKNPAKGEGEKRNGLAVHVHKRGGGPVTVRGNWTDSLDIILLDLANLINSRKLSGRFASELIVLARQYNPKNDGAWQPDEITKEAIQKDTLRVLNKKQGGAKDNVKLKEIIGKINDFQGVQRLAEQILVARQIATAKRYLEPRK